jgi:hypothetical protein
VQAFKSSPLVDTNVRWIVAGASGKAAGPGTGAGPSCGRTTFDLCGAACDPCANNAAPTADPAANTTSTSTILAITASRLLVDSGEAYSAEAAATSTPAEPPGAGNEHAADDLRPRHAGSSSPGGPILRRIGFRPASAGAADPR